MNRNLYDISRVMTVSCSSFQWTDRKRKSVS